MIQLRKHIKQVLSLAVSTVFTVGACLALAGCETKQPRITVTVSFLEETYEIQYQLYRNLYPQTVRHFLELAENGYYDGVAVHDYTSSALYTGGYTYDETKQDNGGLVEKRYFSTVADYNLTQSVFDQATGEGTNTLYGEFENNGFSVESGAQKHKYGSLVMYYTDKSSDSTRVKTRMSSDPNTIVENKSYKYNSATSLFYIFTGSSSSNNASYCVFGQLYDDAADEALDNLLDAISDYVDTLADDESFTETYKMVLDGDDPYVAKAKNTANYAVPVEPILIQSVTIDQY